MREPARPARPAGVFLSRAITALVVLAAVVLGLHLVGAFAGDPRFWGFHQYAFLPRPFLLLLALPILLFLPPVGRAAARALDPLGRALESKAGARAAAAVTIAVLGVLFWLGRQRTFLLSDSELLIRNVNHGFVSFTADTLAAVIQLQFHFLLDRLLHVTSQTASFRVVSIGCGIVWLSAVFLATGRLTKQGGERLFLGGLLATAGLTKLFYGYVETGPLLMAAAGIYFWAMIRWLQDGRGIAAATAAFLIAAAMHVTGLLLFPSFLFGLVRWARGASRRWLAAAAIVLLPVAAYAAFWFARGGTPGGVAKAYAPYFSEFIPLAGPLDAKQAFTLFSIPHLLDFLNEQIYIGPFALLAALVLVGAGRAARRAKAPETAVVRGTGEPWAAPVRTFLALAIAPFLLLSLVFNRKLGGARDWDLVATLAVPSIFFVALSVFELNRRGAPEKGARVSRPPAATALPAAVLLIAIAAAHLAGIILVDADPARSVRHFAALFDDQAPMSRFARSYGLEEMGHYYVALGQPEVAAPYFQKAAVVDPSNVKAIGTLGSWYGSVGRHAEAMGLLREAVRQRPEIALNHYNLGAELARTGDWDEAARAFREAIRLDPRLLVAYSGLGIVYNRAGRLAAADSVVTEGLALFPGDRQNAALYLTRGKIRDKEGRAADAQAAYAEAVKLDPDNAEALFNLGRLLVNRGAWEAAIPPLQRLATLAPGDAEAAVNLGVACLQSGRTDAAIDALTRAVKSNPQLPQAYLNLAEAFRQIGRPADAAVVLEAFVAKNPEDARAMNVPALIQELKSGAAAAPGPPR